MKLTPNPAEAMPAAANDLNPGGALPELVRLGRDRCGDLDQAERREWWLANGRGAYAAGTVAGTLTRRYHGLVDRTPDPAPGARPGARQGRCGPDRSQRPQRIGDPTHGL